MRIFVTTLESKTITWDAEARPEIGRRLLRGSGIIFGWEQRALPELFTWSYASTDRPTITWDVEASHTNDNMKTEIQDMETTPDGGIITWGVDASGSLSNMNTTFQDKESTPLDQQRLIVDRKPLEARGPPWDREASDTIDNNMIATILEKEDTLPDLQILITSTWKKSVLHLVMCLPGGVQIFEATLEGEIITRDREARDTFDNLKATLRDKEGGPPN
ncbi:unnamed protein product [Prorocentrum cordatum]|uniref:Uncharacterized protein n=1 Tax=Prorocentrum cordatum TaxID=2364126 RepID=A0ABN9W8I7_9DINO|nr:unnamed protein product [Polarella glacialis]